MSSNDSSFELRLLQLEAKLATQAEAMFHLKDTLRQAGDAREQDAQSRRKAEAEIANLHAHLRYSLVKEIDLVRYLDDFYFWYKDDISYQWIGNDGVTVRKNYKLTADDRERLPRASMTPKEYLAAGAYMHLTDENSMKFPIFAHFWAQGTRFTYLDVGTNLGIHVIPCAKFARRLGSEETMFAFEPGFVADLAEQNLRINQVDDLIRMERIAVGDTDGATVFNSLLNHSESNSVRDFREFYPDLELARSVLVPTSRLDTFVAKNDIQLPLIVKIDAEGADWPVIVGLGDLIRERVLALFVEFMPRYMREGIKPTDVLEHLVDDFTLINMRTLTLPSVWKYHTVIDRSGVAEFSDAVESSPHAWTDVVAISKRASGHDRLVNMLLTWGEVR